MRVFGLRRAGLILAGVLAIGLAVTVAGRARRPQVVVTEGPAETLSTPVQALPDQIAACVEAAPIPQPAIIVHVAGAVAKPDVYTLDLGARVADALDAAGGALTSADTDGINLALPVHDGEQIYVPSKLADIGPGTIRAGNAEVSQSRPGQSAASPAPPNRADIAISAPKSPESAGPARAGASSNAAHAGLININTASAEELESLPGIGPVLAKRIVDYRSANGPFSTVDGLVRVSGIGEAKLAKISPVATAR